MTSPTLTLAQALDQFQHSTETGKWSALKKEDLLEGLKERTTKPYSVNQGSTFLCGPTAMTFALLKRYPVRYVQICQTLFETGSFGPPWTKNKIFTATASLRAQAPDEDMPAIDWTLAVTLREAENKLFPASSKLGQLTLFDAMNLWATELLNYTHVETTTCSWYGEMDAIQKAKQAVDANGMAFLLIDGALLDRGVGIPMPTHWITVVKPIQLDPATDTKPAHIFFYCFSFGAEYPVDMDQATFKKYLYGAVTAQ